MSLYTEDPEWGRTIDPKRRQMALIGLLRGFPIFETLTWSELTKIERIVHQRHFVAGEVVIRAGAPRSGLIVIYSGSVHIVRKNEDGSSLVVGDLGPGELVGEFAILDDSPRSTSVVAAEPSELIGFFRPDLMQLIETDPRMGFKILYRLSQILVEHLRDVAEGLSRARTEDHREHETITAEARTRLSR